MYSSLFIFAFTVVGAIVNAKMAKVATNSQTTSPLTGSEKDHHPFWNATTDPPACVALSQACSDCLSGCYKHHNLWGFTTKQDCYYGQCNNTKETRSVEPCVVEIKAKNCSDALPKALQKGG
ncbi:BZ3500_MvSof-1268-A1-R1_Chr5-1g07594 [Microbotryum saponariae]|uniref:BZ3500_MvSof-1268-A1-R1_Chr5-1g07594 protein n=1 Tax=Microbotryum saponariae TaxID=289078 RepID=A0A2X0M8I8_9BASI|nr:BZ3500_MvSof-1268-A1-R1_Chr5-1g07594 [Microbotryum saponariae]SDA05465.1 BZ3501_MvSof-1269-A2-R1_Chr5-2g07418 [Microbotryum saponariae]